jgi:hypothetical protein
MRVFILCTGRTGSKTIIEACKHITNYTAAHESRSSMLGEERLNYSNNHIEADNRLSWFLGQLNQRYGDDAFYVHLKRNRSDTVRSLNRRWNTQTSIVKAFANGVLKIPHYLLNKKSKIKICEDYYDSITANIELFLKDKSNKQTIRLESFETDFIEFCEYINAEVDIEFALKDLKHEHNKSKRLDFKNFLFSIKINLIRIKNIFIKN